MMLDCRMNTWVVTYPGNTIPPYRLQCNAEIFVQACLLFGYLIIYIIRMWRVYKVYDLYQSYLQTQKQKAMNDDEDEADEDTRTSRKSLGELPNEENEVISIIILLLVPCTAGLCCLDYIQYVDRHDTGTVPIICKCSAF